MVNPTLSLSESKNIVIASGASLSAATNLGGRIPVGVYIPATWTAAGLSFEVSYDGTTFTPVTDDEGTEYTAVVTASKYVSLDNTKFFGASHIKLRSGDSGTPVNQAAERTVVVMLGRPDVR